MQVAQLAALAALGLSNLPGFRAKALAGFHFEAVAKEKNLASTKALSDHLKPRIPRCNASWISRRRAAYAMVCRFPLLIYFSGDCDDICKGQGDLASAIYSSPHAAAFEANKPEITHHWIINA